MKKVLSLIFINLFVFIFASDDVNKSVISKFAIANYEVLNIDTGNYLFKKNNCENSGYSMFSPFNTNPELLDTGFKSKLVDNGEVLFTTTRSGESINYVFKNFKAVDAGSKVTFDIVVGDKIFKSYFDGKNLTVSDVQNFLTARGDDELGKVCPPCVVVVAVAVVKGAIDICTTASQGCTPCNGTLVVGACSCSCTPKG